MSYLHTPPDWRPVDTGNGNYWIYDDSQNEIGVAFVCDQVFKGRRSPQQLEADARLIAAAPEMFDTLVEAKKVIEDQLQIFSGLACNDFDRQQVASHSFQAVLCEIDQVLAKVKRVETE